MWPTRPRHARRARSDEPALPGLPAPGPPRPVQSILPRRLIDSPSASHPAGGFAFPPPADYVPPSPPREEARPPIRPIGVVEPAAPIEETPSPPPVVRIVTPPAEPIAPPAAPPEPEPVVAYIPPPAVEVEPQPSESQSSEPQPAPIESEPPTEPPTIEPEPRPGTSTSAIPAPELWPAELRALEPEPPRFEPSLPPVEPARVEREPLTIEPAPQAAVPKSPIPEPEMWPAELRALDREPARLEPEPPPLEPEAPPLVHEASTSPPPMQPPPAEPPALPRRRRSKISPHARPHRVLRPAPLQDPGAERAAAVPAPVDSLPKPPLPIESAEAGAGPTPTRDSPLVERCFTLYQAKRFDEVLSVAEPALAGSRHEAPAGPSRETAALWSVVGLAKQALGDDDGAHAALASSIDAALDPERATYRRHLATHALEAAQARLGRAGSHDPVERMAVIRTAIAWAERGLAVVPADQSLGEAREASHEALWEAYEHAATTLVQRQEFTGAREILHEALDDAKLPPVRAAGLRGLLASTFGGEIGQLTAQAIVTMQEGREAEAHGVLQRAEELLAAIPADTIPPARRDEIDQRLWWGYAELGSRRLDAGDYEEALDSLVHALRFTSIGAERQAETRAAVVRALEGIAAVRAVSIRRLAEAGNRDEAIVAAGELNGVVKRGLELGITEDELTAAFARVRRLCEELGIDSRG